MTSWQAPSQKEKDNLIVCGLNTKAEKEISFGKERIELSLSLEEKRKMRPSFPLHFGRERFASNEGNNCFHLLKMVANLPNL